MSFLAVLLSIIFYRNWIGDNPVRENFPVSAWFSWVFRRSESNNGRFVFSVLLPSFLLFWFSAQFNHGFAAIIWLVIAMLTLLYCIEIIDIDILIDDQLIGAQKLDDKADLQEASQQHRGFVTGLSMDVFESLVPVIFWFLFLGPAGALFYLLSVEFVDQADDELAEWLDLLVFCMQWIPVRVTLMLFALVGDFSLPWKAFVSSLSDVESTASEVLTPVIELALLDATSEQASNVQDFVHQVDDSLTATRDLLVRSLWGWVGISAVLTIFGL